MKRFFVVMSLVVLVAPRAFGAEPEKGLAEKPITAAEAVKKVGESVTVEMQVKSAKLNGDVCFLNSESNFKDPGDLTVFIGKDALARFKAAQIDDPAAKFKGKVVRVKGKVILYHEHPEIALTGPDDIKLVEDKQAPPEKTPQR